MKRRFGPMAALFCMLLLALHGVAVASSGNTNPTTGAFTPSAVTMKTNVGSSTSVAINLFDLSSPPLTIDTITISGAQATDFSLSGSCAPGAVVNRSVGPCALKITFTPGALGARTAAINATFVNAPSLTVPVSGEGIAPDAVIHVSFTAPLDFGSKPLGLVMTPVTRSDVFLQISNTGGSLLTGSTTLIGANPGDFALAGISTKGSGCVPNFALSPQNLPCNLPITFLPTALGPRSATLRIASNDAATPFVDIALSGVGIPALPPPPPPPIVSAADFTDLWSVAGETDRSLGITHHKFTTDVLVAFWHTYDVDGRDMWLELKDGHWVDSLTYTGNLHRSTGTAFSFPDNPSLFSDAVVGTATLSFTNSSNGTFSYDVNGTTGSLAITRVAF